MTHTHVATGLAGYGPDGEDYATFDSNDLTGIAEAIRSELALSIDALADEYTGLGEAGLFAEAYTVNTMISELETLRANLDPQRANAPLYRDNVELWESTLRDLISQANGTYVSSNTKLYVWDECGESECEQDLDT